MGLHTVAELVCGAHHAKFMSGVAVHDGRGIQPHRKLGRVVAPVQAGLLRRVASVADGVVACLGRKPVRERRAFKLWLSRLAAVRVPGRSPQVGTQWVGVCKAQIGAKAAFNFFKADTRVPVDECAREDGPKQCRSCRMSMPYPRSPSPSLHFPACPPLIDGPHACRGLLQNPICPAAGTGSVPSHVLIGIVGSFPPVD